MFHLQKNGSVFIGRAAKPRALFCLSYLRGSAVRSFVILRSKVTKDFYKKRRRASAKQTTEMQKGSAIVRSLSL